MKFGVVRFPGSCDEVDALHACRRYGDAELLWHGDRDLKGVDAVIVPGGFSYGDYLRGAIARFSPVMEAVAAFAREGGPVLGICNGFQVLCEAGLPGRAAAQRRPALRLPPGRRGGGQRPRPVHRRVRGGRGPVDPGQAHDRPLLRARPGARRHGGTRARWSSATRPATTRTARCATSPASTNEAGNVFGLMPHPEHAVDELTGSVDGLKLFESIRER